MTIFSKNQINFYTVTIKDEGQRLDNLLIKILKTVPKSHIYKIIRSAEVRINKKRCHPEAKVILNDVIRIPPINIPNKSEMSKFTQINHINSNIKFSTIFEDDYFLIIHKPEGVACHGGSGISFGVIEILRKNKPEYKFLELAHRLDKGTSGILILAKKRSALVEIQNLMRNNLIKKYYLALTIGVWQESKRDVKAPLYKYVNKNGERQVKIDHNLGQYAQTTFTTLSQNDTFTLVKANLKTGRTHQIRVHLQHIGYPIVGDDKYGDFEVNKRLQKLGLRRMFLHAYEIIFIHPITHQTIQVKADLPDNLNAFFSILDICKPAL